MLDGRLEAAAQKQLPYSYVLTKVRRRRQYTTDGVVMMRRFRFLADSAFSIDRLRIMEYLRG